ncbi:transglutaminase family protein [Roseimaritima ulvae]|uniref:Transglutaminase-like superfamily protein n=1 Tax=Roseimaritima ulvae TaxID=980254 RepID=A0A5B9QUV4_9BACT|nr:transglutaminase domain-containing protein [Roseimaritima ulvae]QEG40846.1 Transglutaminase-like superfamily protein [Roseimaritima ulvae]
MPTWSRRRIESILLTALAISGVIAPRYVADSPILFAAEVTSLVVACLIAIAAQAFAGRWRHGARVAGVATVVLGLVPVLFAIVARLLGSPGAFEITALTTLGSVSLAMAVGTNSNRIRAQALILSGFLVLFCASISDSSNAVVLPIIWMLGCVWHLIANHWERLDLAMPDSVQKNWSLRPGILITTLLVLVAGGLAVKGRINSSTRLNFGFMPTSGGSEWSDPAARSGVGTGDAAVAAKDHAESFGAVDSDLFLESTEPSLFDMMNDMIGEPKQKPKSERKQAVGKENVIPTHEQAAKSEQGGGSFSTERTPPKQHRHAKDAIDASVVQWDGPTGIRLAMQRYDSFDGKNWTQSEDLDLSNEQLQRVNLQGNTWFFDPGLRAVISKEPDAASVGLLKIIRLDSQRLPVPMLSAGVHVKEVIRDDFFAISADGCFYMPGRDKVPPLTVVHVASAGLTEDAIRAALSEQSPASQQGSANDQVAAADNAKQYETLAAYVKRWTDDKQAPYEKLQAIVAHLRSDFVFVRYGQASATSLPEFWQSRCGGDHLFATTAALAARQIGLSSRLVTGFYVRPQAFDIAAGHASVLPDDVHVWAEVQLDDGRWFEIEPTPGYRQPHYRASWRLLARRFAAEHWQTFAWGVLVCIGVYITRRLWIDWSLSAVWRLAGCLRPRRRLRLAMGIIETRARLAGQCRPKGTSQRVWLEQLTRADATLARAVHKFSDSADALFFGPGGGDPSTDPAATDLVSLLRVQTIIVLAKKANV